ncbi:MBL fold metallo-hydrolase [Cellulosimicrobium marinum]|uniref:MBL fold metallo-hydrolase n=1 Tax=Cellulosimicrobium marinum TaxID=1638992 RepID=UPI001E5EA362|nr:MBL fold metallo-hydrolase [Cellulosimicrobium marinum]MCB7135144.1 MBL fold metallo-hydrolase [Cellulosimicrobium marinum]
MTLDGTRSYVLRAPGSPECVVVDPGPDDVAHLEALAATGCVVLVLVTHRHADHTAGSARLHALSGAPVRAADPAFCHGGDPLADGETVRAAGVVVQVVATPGHTADSVCLVLPDDGPSPTVLTGDTVLGTGTTVLAEPDGSLAAYLASLEVIEALCGDGPATGLPGHGPAVDDLAARVRAYRTHRLLRLAQVRGVLAELGLAPGDDDAVERVTERVYADVEPSVRPAARQSVAAQLDFLRAASEASGTMGA